jgi:hypothetical protein
MINYHATSTYLTPVTIDPGIDSQIPTISTSGIVCISVLLALYLLGLLATAGYACVHD